MISLRKTQPVGGWGTAAMNFIAPGSGLVADLAQQDFAPSADAQDQFTELNNRWNALFSWGAPGVIPTTAPEFSSWLQFKKDWEGGSPDTTALQAQRWNLQIAENVASDHGFPNAYTAASGQGNYGTKNALPDVPVESQTLALSAAAAVDNAVPGSGVRTGVTDALKDALGPHKPDATLWSLLPMWAKAGIIIGALGVTASIAAPYAQIGASIARRRP